MPSRRHVTRSRADSRRATRLDSGQRRADVAERGRQRGRRPTRPARARRAHRPARRVAAAGARALGRRGRAVLAEHGLDEAEVEEWIERYERVGCSTTPRLAEQLVRTPTARARARARRRSLQELARARRSTRDVIDAAARRRSTRRRAPNARSTSPIDERAQLRRLDRETAERRLVGVPAAARATRGRSSRPRRRVHGGRSDRPMQLRSDVGLAYHDAAPSPTPSTRSSAHCRRAAPRTYEVRTFGCQMNVHDSERLSGSLESAGYVRAEPATRPTSSSSTPAPCARTPPTSCTATSATSQSVKRKHEGMQIAVGGCLAQMDKQTSSSRRRRGSTSSSARTTWARCPSLLERARHNGEAELEILESLEVFPSTLPDQARLAPTAAGCRSRSAATTPARSASCRACAARRRTAGPATSSNEIQAARRRRRHRGHAARPERQLLRRRVRRPAGVRQAAARRRRDRRARAHPLHEPAPGRVHRRRHRRDGRDARRHAAAAHAAAVGLRPHPQGDAPLVPQRAVPRHPRPRARPHPERGDHDRHHRRLPRRDRRGLRGDAARRRAGALRARVHLPVLDPRGHARRDDARPGAEGGRPGALRAPHRAAGAHLAAKRTSSSSAARSRCSSPRARARRMPRRTA